MSENIAVTVQVTQDCIDQATLTPLNCPVARAVQNAGLRHVHVGHTAVTAADRQGRTITASLSPALQQLIRRFDNGGVITPGNYPLSFKRSKASEAQAG